MIEISEEILYSAMRAVLRVGMNESYEFDVFSIAMQSLSDEFVGAIIQSGV